MQRILYLIQKEFRQILREPAFLGLIFGAPLIQVLILGFAITTDVKNVPMIMVDQDHSQMSNRLVEAFSNTKSFHFLGQVGTAKEAVHLLDRNKIKLAVVIPPHFERDLKTGRQPRVQLLADGVDGNSAGVALSYANQIALKLQKQWFPRLPHAPGTVKEIHLTGIEARMLYNPSLESVNNIVPGILAVLVMLITSFLTGMTIVREKEIGTLEQLMVTPIRRGELILGKVIPLIIVGLLLFTIAIISAGLVFGLWMKGNILTLYGMSLLFMMTTLGMGIFASTLARNQQQSMFITWFLGIFAILLSGFFIPIENMPRVIQWITYLNPVRYFMIVIREIYLKGTALHYLWKEALEMTVFGGAMLTMATLRFHKRVG